MHADDSILTNLVDRRNMSGNGVSQLVSAEQDPLRCSLGRFPVLEILFVKGESVEYSIKLICSERRTLTNNSMLTELPSKLFASNPRLTTL